MSGWRFAAGLAGWTLLMAWAICAVASGIALVAQADAMPGFQAAESFGGGVCITAGMVVGWKMFDGPVGPGASVRC